MLQASCLTADGCMPNAAQANDTLNLFYTQNCVYDQNNADQNAQQQTGDQVVQSSSDPTSAVSNLAMYLGIPGSFVGLFAFTCGPYIWFKRAVSLALLRSRMKS
jgi:hypothetical protein